MTASHLFFNVGMWFHNHSHFERNNHHDDKNNPSTDLIFKFHKVPFGDPTTMPFPHIHYFLFIMVVDVKKETVPSTTSGRDTRSSVTLHAIMCCATFSLVIEQDTPTAMVTDLSTGIFWCHIGPWCDNGLGKDAVSPQRKKGTELWDLR